MYSFILNHIEYWLLHCFLWPSLFQWRGSRSGIWPGPGDHHHLWLRAGLSAGVWPRPTQPLSLASLPRPPDDGSGGAASGNDISQSQPSILSIDQSQVSYSGHAHYSAPVATVAPNLRAPPPRDERVDLNPGGRHKPGELSSHKQGGSSLGSMESLNSNQDSVFSFGSTVSSNGEWLVLLFSRFLKTF